MTRKRVRIGDVFRLDTPKGFALLQYSHETKTDGSIVRVLPGLYRKASDDMEGLVGSQELFFVFVALRAALAKSLIAEVGWYPIPAHATAFPLFRQHELPAQDGTPRWSLWDGKNNTFVQDLSSEQRRLPIRAIVTPDLLATRLAEGWLPENEATPIFTGRPQEEQLRHYLYFADVKAAVAAKERLAAAGARTELREAAGRDQRWLVLVLSQPGTADLDAALQKLVRELGGQYDGYDRAH